jgi:hypothetical protein
MVRMFLIMVPGLVPVSALAQADKEPSKFEAVVQFSSLRLSNYLQQTNDLGVECRF